MDSASLPSLTPLLDGIDQWVEMAPLLPVLISLELVLSADNAVALASITKRLSDIDLQRRALNFGIGISLILRILIILMAQWVLNFWFIQLIAGLYLIALLFNKLLSSSTTIDNNNDRNSRNEEFSLLQTIIILAFTDLAFSIDSVAAAVAISDQFLLVITGAIIGVIALRFTSGLFIRWLEVYSRLELAGYIAVGIIGFKLLLQLLIPTLIITQWFTFIVMVLLFVWGFSKKQKDFKST